VKKNRMIRKILFGDSAHPNKYIKMKIDKPTPKAKETFI
jgi:hypothetical protein